MRGCYAPGGAMPTGGGAFSFCASLCASASLSSKSAFLPDRSLTPSFFSDALSCATVGMVRPTCPATERPDAGTALDALGACTM